MEISAGDADVNLGGLGIVGPARGEIFLAFVGGPEDIGEGEVGALIAEFVEE
jgi:hypothetical protein